MASEGEDGGESAGHQSIPLRDLAATDAAPSTQRARHTRGRSLLSGGSRAGSGQGFGYERLDEASPGPSTRDRSYGPLAIPEQGYVHNVRGDDSPIDPAEFQMALGFEGLSLPHGGGNDPPVFRTAAFESPSFEHLPPYATPYGDEHDETNTYLPATDSDQAPLTDARYLQPISGAAPPAETSGRSSFQSVRFNSERPSADIVRDNLAVAEAGMSRPRQYGLGESLSPGGLTRNRSVASSMARASSIVRAVSQRVVNLSNEPEPVESTDRTSAGGGRPPHILDADNGPSSTPPVEKPLELRRRGRTPPNPLKGNTLGIFGPENSIRLKLCELLIHPFTEPFILLLIVIQSVVLTIEAAPNVYEHPRPDRWGHKWSDWALLMLFVVYTIELIAKIIVSGFVQNAREYSTIDRSKSVRTRIMDQYRYYFSPQRQDSLKATNRESYAPPIVRSFTMQPRNAIEQQRQQLARRAFLRHGFNRLDFVAVVSFWIAFALSITGIESRNHLYLFEMLSSLRIIRLLALTNGTSIILKSLKKAAPSLLNVSFLIVFFWLLFAIVGIQSFKSSLSRQCLWMDPEGIQPNFNNNFTFCGGYLDNVTGDPMPWVFSDFTPGASKHKGYLCPRQSVCMLQSAPYNGTVNFDNILQSLELVFIIISANTFSDLLYYTTNSDYLAAALYFAAGIVILTFWLMNLLIAVITSSFQVIREESKASAFAADEQTLLPEQPKPIRKISALKRFYDRTFWLWILAIVADLITMGFRSASMSEDTKETIDNTETVVTFILLGEIILRFIADWRVFHRSYTNLVDLFLAVTTTVILLPPIRNSGQAYGWLSIFQIVRIYRVVLAVSMTRKLIVLVLGNAVGIANLVFFVFLITFMAAILAAQLFRGDIPEVDSSGNTIEVPFFNIWNSFIGMYQILSSENWSTILYNVTAFDNYLNTGWIGATFLVGWFILANSILVNMFIAVIQENFDVSEDEKRLQQVKAFLQRKELGTSSTNISLSTILSLGRSTRRKDPLDYGPATVEMLLKDAVVRDFLADDLDPLQQSPQEEDSPTVTAREQKRKTFWQRLRASLWDREPNPFYSNINFASSSEGLTAREMAKEAVSATSQRKKAQREYLKKHPNYNVSLFIFRPANPIRKMCQRLVGPGRGHERIDGIEPNRLLWYSFSALIYAAILAMVLLACVTTPLYQKEYFTTHTFQVKNWFVWTDMSFAALFTVEALIKIVADGFLLTPNAYFRSTWGMIDGIVLVTLWINVGTSLYNDGAVSRSVGAFKALRALRLLNVSDSARNTFHSVIIIGGFKILSAAFVSMALLIPFALYGVNLFNGKLASCNDGSTITNLTSCFGEYNSTPFNNDWPVLAPRVVSNPYYSFDDFGSSLFILFQIVSQEGWIDVMSSAMAITGVGLQPQDFASQWNAIFFIIFNLLATVFILTLFISVFMRNYTEQTGVAFLTADQRSWLELRKLLRQISPSKRPSGKHTQGWRDWCYKRAVKKHGRWHRAMTWVLVLHLILLVLEFYPEPDWWDRTRDYIFLAFTVFYMVNIFIRIFGLGWTRFRKSSWDLFALLAVTGTMITTILLLSDFGSQLYVQLHKLFLVSITLLLIPRNNSLDQLFKTAAASLTSIANLLATWFVLFLVFAIAMTQTFGLTRFGDNEDDNVNFRDVPKALILLFRMSCGEGWNQIMEDFAGIEPPLCVEGSSFFDSDCGSSTWARVLFIAWNIVSMYIFVSLFVSLIYESFSYVYQRHSGHAIVSREEIRRFKQAWATIDPEGTGFITKEQFPKLLSELSGVFAMRIHDEADSVHRILEDVGYDSLSRRTHSIVGSIHTTINPTSIDLELLNERLNRMDVRKIQERRKRYNVFYEEVMVSADPERGISFTGVLMILAHYNIINDSKSLRLEEYLRRRARMHRVEDEVQRRTVINFFDTVYHSRQFRKWKNRYDTARMTNIPKFDVPEIMVDEGQSPSTQKQPPPLLSPLNTALDHRRTISSELSPRSTSPSRSPTLHPRHAHGTSSISFELPEPTSPGSRGSSRRGSSVNAEDVMVSLDNSAWGESLRRSFTMRRPPQQ